MARGLDYSSGRPRGSVVRAEGYEFVVRYVSEPGGLDKDITPAEYADMQAHGVAVAIVYQSGTGDALEGLAGGRRRAAKARRYASAVGFPAHRPIYMAVDMDVTHQMPAVLDYLRGAGDALGGAHMVGVYGEYDVIEAAARAGVAQWFWQTKAWSGGRWSPRAHIRQFPPGLPPQVTVDGVTCDLNTTDRDDYGQWPTEDDMPYSREELVRIAGEGAVNALKLRPDVDAKLLALMVRAAVETTRSEGVSGAGQYALAGLHVARGVAEKVGAPDVDETALAAELAPLLVGQLGRLDEETLTRIAEAVNNEQARRQAE